MPKNCLRVNMLKCSKYCWNIHVSSFVKFFSQCERTSVHKILSKKYLKTRDNFLTYWLPMTSILSLKSRRLTKSNQMKFSPKPKIFSHFFSPFLTCTSQFNNFEQKDAPPSWFISGVIDSKKRAYLNAEKAPGQNTYDQLTC